MGDAADLLTAEDRDQLARHGLRPEQVAHQLELFREPPPRLRLLRPCKVGDGVVRLPEERQERLAAHWREASAGLAVTKFVPASGAATRMFGALIWCHARADDLPLERLREMAGDGHRDAATVVRFLDEIDRQPFHGLLAAALAEEGHDLGALLRERRHQLVLRALLTPAGLDYAGTPKGLIPFHRYPDGPRTAFVEQLVEGAGYIGRGGESRHHFTAAPGQLDAFRRHLAAARARREVPPGSRSSFSVQHPSSDTVAVDLANRPLRGPHRQLVLRPGGHGALLRNLDRLDADVAFVKNIDNILPLPGQPTVVRWKSLLGGYVLRLRERVFAALEALETGAADALEGAAAVARDDLFRPPPDGVAGDELRAWLVDRLDRPLRVCGMVPNEGEPGGGPFWVREPDGSASLQIVEPGQVDREREDQRGIWAAATHFNPVDLACSLRNRTGAAYDLGRFHDPDAVFIAEKRHEGRPMKALERPGLWNGAMAGWNTVFVEVPAETFAPVKTVLDLLRPEHQVDGGD